MMMAILLIILLIAIIVTGNSGIRDVEIIVPLKNKKKTLEMSVINCEITLQLACS